MRNQYEQVLIRIIQDAIAMGAFGPVSAKMVVFGFLTMFDRAHQWLSPDGAMTSREVPGNPSDLAIPTLVKRHTSCVPFSGHSS